MQKFFVAILFLSFAVAVSGQAAKKPKAPSAIIQPSLKTGVDSVSYAIGLSLASFYKKQGIDKVNTEMLDRAINDVMKGRNTLLNEQQANTCMMDYMQKAASIKASAGKKEGAAFLNANKTKPGVVVLPSGLQYMILKEGTGPKPADTSRVRVHYHGTLIDGTVFESSVQRGQPVEFAVNGVISGWREALQLMPQGSKWRLFVPSELAYGDQGNGPIKPGSTLIFDVELLDILK